MIYFFNVIFSTAAAIVTVVISCILMVLLTMTFGKECMHQKSLLAAWIIFVLFVGLGLFYIRHSYMEVVETHIKIYQNIFRHCARTLQNKIISNQPEHLLSLRQYLQNSEKNKICNVSDPV